jgi:hypothetical protein
MSCRVGCRRNGAAHLGCVAVLRAPLALIVCGAPEVLQEAVLLLAHHEGVRPVQVVEEVDHNWLINSRRPDRHSSLQVVDRVVGPVALGDVVDN